MFILLDSPVKVRPASPTMTMFTRAATDEVYSMFNQPLEKDVYNDETDNFDDEDDDKSDDDYEDLTNYTNFEHTETNLEDEEEEEDTIKEIKNVTNNNNNEEEDEDDVGELISNTSNLNFEDQENRIPSTPISKNYHAFYSKLPTMTPIVEITEPISFTPAKSLIANSKQRINNIDEEEEEEENVENYCNPIDESTRRLALSKLSPSIITYPGYNKYDKDFQMSQVLKKLIKSQNNNINIDNNNTQNNKIPILEFSKNSSQYYVRSLLGEGGYASAYLCESNTGYLKAIKVENPSNSWEFYIISQLKKRLLSNENENGHGTLKSIVGLDEIHQFNDESYLIIEYLNQGTVLDLVNNFKTNINSGIDEILVIFITIELLKIINSLHEVGILHGDLKPDNCMLRFENDNNNLNWSQQYERDGSNGWLNKGIKLIDFGRSIDMLLFPKNVQFICDWETDQQDCQEMRDHKPWTYQSDYYGLANIIHTLLFGNFIEIIQIENSTKYKLKNPFKRYWQQEMWNDLFDILLNSSSFNNGNLPLIDLLKQQRINFEDWLEMHSNEKNTLKSIIINIQDTLEERKRK